MHGEIIWPNKLLAGICNVIDIFYPRQIIHGPLLSLETKPEMLEF